MRAGMRAWQVAIRPMVAAFLALCIVLLPGCWDPEQDEPAPAAEDVEMVSDDQEDAEEASLADDAEPEEESLPDGGYLLAGTVRVHDEDVNGTMVTVVSMTLDGPLDYTYDYKGYETTEVAMEVELESSLSETYGTWATYAGQHIVVWCEELRGAYHDGSYHQVDAFAMGEMRLVTGAHTAVFNLNDLYGSVELQSGMHVFDSRIADYDGDGRSEAFVITGNDDDAMAVRSAEVWFASSEGDVSRVSDGVYEGVLQKPQDTNVTSGKYQFVTLREVGEDGSVAHVFGVKDGVAREMTFDIEDVDAVVGSEGEIEAFVPTENHQFMVYGLELDEEGFAFRSTGVKRGPVSAG